MKRARFFAFPVLALVAMGATACEDPTSASTNTPSGNPDGGVVGDGGGVVEDPPVPNTCPAPTAAPVEHSKYVEADETWGPGLHDVTFSISVVKGATLTIEPCAVVRIKNGHSITVGETTSPTPSKLVARAKAGNPITIEGLDGEPFGNVIAYPTGVLELVYVEVKNGGGGNAREGAAVHLYGDQNKPLQSMGLFDHVSIAGSKRYGVILEGRAGFTDGSQFLTISGSGDSAMRVNAPGLGTIPTGRYTGNTVDRIRVMGSGGAEVIDVDTTMHNRGVPYLMGGDGRFSSLNVGGNTGAALLTIEPGVTIKFSKGSGRESGLFVQRSSTTTASTGALRAVGTADAPIVFTSDEPTPAAGDWVGIVLNGIPDPRSKIDYARVEYAGGDTGTRGFSCGTEASDDKISNEAGIAIFGEPASQFITNTTITKSAKNGIERAWTGAYVDFRPSNTFTDNAFCRQTAPRPTTGSCPDPAPCD